MLPKDDAEVVVVVATIVHVLILLNPVSGVHIRHHGLYRVLLLVVAAVAVVSTAIAIIIIIIIITVAIVFVDVTILVSQIAIATAARVTTVVIIIVITYHRRHNIHCHRIQHLILFVQ